MIFNNQFVFQGGFECSFFYTVEYGTSYPIAALSLHYNWSFILSVLYCYVCL